MMKEGYAHRRAVTGDILQITRGTCINIVADTAGKRLGRTERGVTEDAFEYMSAFGLRTCE